VTVWTAEGKLIGRIRLPGVCPNIAFGEPKRNWLFMCGSQSLYALYVNTQGVAPSSARALNRPWLAPPHSSRDWR
jgi:gluconolactonase